MARGFKTGGRQKGNAEQGDTCEARAGTGGIAAGGGARRDAARHYALLHARRGQVHSCNAAPLRPIIFGSRPYKATYRGRVPICGPGGGGWACAQRAKPH
jgi:hypothetical protein